MQRGINTRGVHGGEKVEPITKALKTPIYASNTFSYPNMEKFFEAASNAYGINPEEITYFYSRTANPTSTALELKLATIIGCKGTLATSSGMAAITFIILANYKSGTKILASDSVYRSTNQFTTETLPKMGIACDYLDFRDLGALEKQLNKDTYSVVHFESPANPTMRCYDIKAICDLVHEYNSETKVTFDNTFASPVCQRPLELGVDFEVHSSSKFINGHGDALGGVIACNDTEILSEFRRQFGETLGQTPSPLNSYLILRGLKTLGLRVNQQSKNALKIAKYLEEHQKVNRVYYPGLSSHPQYEVARKQMNPFGGMLSFELENAEKVRDFLADRLRIILLAMDLGDIQSLIEWPYIMTHYDLEYNLKITTGITESLLRLSVGIEDVEDLISDFEQGLKHI
ncbi:MAG: PLP-dependent transferase [Candidatus Heimdallarchaeota archaeon]|nr:MAG: PLP-dependent transferase [Candidatus Heimdallarchaeota archaeon]